MQGVGGHTMPSTQISFFPVVMDPFCSMTLKTAGKGSKM